MTRKIKFRVWNHKRKEWLHRPGHEVNLLGETILFGELFSGPLDELNDIIALQYTGFLDKNGKEIYEGDIIHDGGVSETVLHQAEIIFHNGAFIANCGENGIWNLAMTGKMSQGKVSVIGNIFENPELLTQLTPPIFQEIKEGNLGDFRNCEQCGQRAWDGRICHACGLKEI